MDGKLDQLQGAVDSGGVSLATDTVVSVDCVRYA